MKKLLKLADRDFIIHQQNINGELCLYLLYHWCVVKLKAYSDLNTLISYASLPDFFLIVA